MHSYPIHLHHIYISPGHNYFGHPADAPGTHPTHDVERAEVRAGRGLVGDRFFDVRPDFDGQITFFAWEVYQQLVAQLDPTGVTPAALRRNVVLSGVPLNGLIGQAFTIVSGEGATRSEVRCRGTKHCSPCRWMDRGVAPGALPFLKGHGGLRAQLLSDGTLVRGPALLYTDAALDLEAITQPLPRPRLPS